VLETVLLFGAIIFVGIAFILAKLPIRWSLRIFGHAVAFDIFVTVLVLWIHWGTMTGLMSATVAGIICAVCTSTGRRLFGYIRGSTYYPGVFNVLKD
jgi:energy-coupling factor transporter transmembrane protein EcfT